MVQPITFSKNIGLLEMQAIFLAAGPDFNQDNLSALEGICSIDIAPTILDLLDVKPAPTVEGESILEQNAGNDLQAALDRFEDYILGVIDDGAAVNDILNLGGDRLLNTITDLISPEGAINSW